MNQSNIAAIYPLSPLQEGLLFHTLYSPDEQIYVKHLSMDLECRGIFQPALFEQAWQTIVARHDVLRSAFSWEKRAQPLQVVLKQVELPVISLDWSDRSATEQARQLHLFLDEDRARGFDLTQAPLARIAVISLGENTFQCVFSYHHLLLDGWSISLILNELFTLYDGLSSGQEVVLPQPRPYRDYIAWLQSRDGQAAEHFWRDRLQGFQAPNRLRIGNPWSEHMAEVSTAYEKIQMNLPAPELSALQRLARQEHLTLNTLVMGAWTLLLNKFSGDLDIVFGITVSGRPAELRGMEAMVGLFINTLPFRVQVRPEENLLAWLKDIQLQQAELLEYQYNSLADVQSWSELPRQLNLSLFESLLVFENFPGEQIDENTQGALRLRDVQPEVRTNYPLTVMIGPGRQLVLLFGYDSQRFARAEVELLGRHLIRLLTVIPTLLARRLDDIPFVSKAEQHTQLAVWNAPWPVLNEPACFSQLFEAQVAQTPERPALLAGERQLSYCQLNERANQLAHFLRQRGVGPDVCVALLVEHTGEALIGILGIFKAGGAYVPLDPVAPSERLSFILGDTRACLVLTQENLRALCPPGAPPVLCLDSEWSSIECWPATNPEVACTPAQLAYVMYTSGSTGHPKGVMITQGGLVNYALWVGQTLLGQEVSCQPATTRFAFDVSLRQIFPPLLRGEAVWMVPDDLTRQPELLLSTLRSARQVGLSCPPSLWRLILEVLEDQRETLPPDCLTALYLGGERLNPELARRTLARLPGLALWNVYGPTETTTNSSAARLLPDQEVNIGTPITQTQIYLLDERLHLVPPGLPGEIYIGGAGLARGYLGQAALTATRFVPHPFSQQPGARLYRTGDLARYRPDGSIEYLERKDRQIKLRGFRLEPEEIEQTLLACPGVRATAVLAHEDAPGDLRLVAYLVLEKESSLTDTALRQFLQKSLPDYMVPSTFLRLPALPLSPNGKIDYQALDLQADHSRPVLETAYTSPQSDLEQTLAQIWQEVLHVERVGIHDNFFDLGGHSLHMIRVFGRLKKQFPDGLTLIDLFRYPTIQRLASFLRHRDQEEPVAAPARSAPTPAGTGATRFALVGMAGKFPGAGSLADFWQNLCDGVESISFFSDEELLADGVPPELVANPRYVKAYGILEDPEYFDATFFNYTPREAEIMDPQQRLFLETAWEALEHAGYDPLAVPGRVGVYAGMGAPAYLFFHLLPRPEVLESLGGFQLMVGNGNDALTTRVAYKLNLAGPSLTIQTACSTSLVAVHQACQSLAQRECDMALAGGVTLGTFRKVGYLYQEGGISSPDGHCRAFDAQAQGTTFGNGVGIVVLKRLEDALAAGDQIYAVILGSAVNNDGADKVGFTAPSIQGQAAVITQALSLAGVEADSISYIEAHGTGTPLGDPIEVAALTHAFRAQTARTGFCGLGTVKSNIGHLDAAAGVAGLIKTALALYHRQIPPTLHIRQPNPQLGIEGSPFYLNTTLQDWPAGATPRRAGVSSFGVGGTNAHVILEEPPEPVRPAETEANSPKEQWQLLPLSARSPLALRESLALLGEHLLASPELCLEEVAYTLQAGRHAFPVRTFLTASDLPGAIDALESASLGHISLGVAPEVAPPIAFLFPGGGAQHVLMGRDLWRHDEVFREYLENCLAFFPAWLADELRELLTDSPQALSEQGDRLKQTRWGLPALFCLEYALAQRWLSWGIRPQALLGHSMGEYVAACLAGVFSPRDAAHLVLQRALLFEQLPSGAMLSVALAEEEVLALLPPELSLATCNAPRNCVVSGNRPAIETFAHHLRSQGYECQILHIDVAAHSQEVELILAPFVEFVRQIHLSPPRIPFLSNVTGTWITSEQATDPQYWGRHLRQTVRFGQGLRTLLQQGPFLLLEVGPGSTLTTLVRLTLSDLGEARERAMPSMRHPSEKADDRQVLLQALGKLWVAGIDLPGEFLASNGARRRVPLPTYPFERQRYWIESPQTNQNPAGIPLQGERPEGLPAKTANVADWFYLSSWQLALPHTGKQPVPTAGTWLIFLDRFGLGRRLAASLRQHGMPTVLVSAGARFALLDDSGYQLNPEDAADYSRLAQSLAERAQVPQYILHLWSLLGPQALPSGPQGFQQAQSQGYLSLLWWLQAWEKSGLLEREPGLTIQVLTDHLHAITDDEDALPEQATLLALCRVIQQEYLSVTCRCLDMVLPACLSEDVQSTALFVEGILTELLQPVQDLTLALRGTRRIQRWRPAYENLQPPALESADPVFRERGVYLLTGGLGRVARLLARYLAEHYQARLALVARTPLPERTDWQAWLETHQADDAVSLHLRRLLALEQAGAEVLVLQADVSKPDELRQAVETTLDHFGTIHGVFHTAGATLGESVSTPLKDLTPALIGEQFAPKVWGLYALEETLRGRQLDFCLLFSSNAAVLGGLGFGAYGAANAFMDAFVLNRRRQWEEQHPCPWISATWDGWPLTEEEQQMELAPTSMTQYMMSHAEAIQALEYVLTLEAGEQIIVSTGPLLPRLRLWVERQGLPTRPQVAEHGQPALRGAHHPRPGLRTAYVAPEGEIEQQLALIWQEVLGIEGLGVHDNLYELGGHSLLATQIISRTRSTFQVDIPLASLIVHPTIAEQGATVLQLLAARIDETILQQFEKQTLSPLEKKGVENGR